MASGKRALTFHSNRVATEEEDYFSMLEIAVDMFTHTWSLSVEVQFYFIIPIFFIIGFKVVSDEYQLHLYAIFASLSFIYSFLFCTETQAFNSVLARVWQFFIVFRWYLKLSNRLIVALCTVLLFSNAVLLYEDQLKKWISPLAPCNSTRLDGISDGNVSFSLAEQLNHDWSVNDFKNLWAPSCRYETRNGPLGWCRHKGLQYIRGCDPLFNPPEVSHCRDTVSQYGQRISKEKPDYVFITTKFNHLGDPIPAGITKIEDDQIYQAMQLQTKLMSKSVKHNIFLLLSIPHVRSYKVKDIVETVKRGKSLIQFDKSLMKRSPIFARLRYEKLIENCEKCIPIDYKPYFWNTTTNYWRFYDEKNNGLSYVTSPNHLSFHGLELVRNIYTNICRSL